jgi:uncharacterized membrane protein YoaK (UPF0700 family)
MPVVLSTTAGAVDVVGFLALGGLFTAHITGNLVVLAAHYITGGFSDVGPLLAVPVFVFVLSIVTLLSVAAEKAGYASRRALLCLQVALLISSLSLGASVGPFENTDAPMAVLVSMFAVAAMATQNALVRLDIPGAPSTAMMTANITQLTVELATIVWARGGPDDLARARCRASAALRCFIGFLAGCLVGAFLEFRFGLLALALPVALAVLAVPLGELRRDDRAQRPNSNEGWLGKCGNGTAQKI